MPALNDPRQAAALFREQINDYLKSYYEQQRAQAESWSPDYERLWGYLETVSLAGGKRLRPFLALQSYQAFGGKNIEDLLPLAAALELLHLGMLVHDDIIDRDEIRHGVQNVAGHYRKYYSQISNDDISHYASSAALLGGDLLLSDSYQLILGSNIEIEQKVQLCKLVGHTLHEVIGGELLDTEAALKPNDTDSLLIARMKTASYTCVLPMQAGAITAGCDPAVLPQLEAIGNDLGIAFQLLDDELGVFGEPAVTGKSASSDLREGKRTRLLQLSFAMATPEQATVLSNVGKADLSQTEAEAIRKVIEGSGARAAHRSEYMQHAERAEQAIRKLPIDAATAEALVGTFRGFIQRNA